MIVLLIWIAGLLTGTILSCACMCRKPKIVIHEITDNTECLTVASEQQVTTAGNARKGESHERKI